jgi:hypothetical protein
MKLTGALLEEECDELFSYAKRRQQNKHHPARGVLSNQITDFFVLDLDRENNLSH